MKKQTNVGGQAVIEGVMMKSPNYYAVAIRKPDQEIETKIEPYKSFSSKFKPLQLPLIRGMVAFVESIYIGTKVLGYSAEFFEVEEEKSKVDEWIEKKFGDKTEKVLIGVSMVLALIFSMALFVFLPLGASQLLKPILKNSLYINFADGIIRVIIFLGYLYLVSLMKDIRRVFEYHGAEHKTINCYEQGMELNMENVQKCTRFHKRCGTNFLFIVVFISIIVMTVVNAQTLATRLIARLILLPVVAGFSYEVIKWLGRTDSKLSDIGAAPGLWLQRLTTREPSKDQLEVALKSLQTVLAQENGDVEAKA